VDLTLNVIEKALDNIDFFAYVKFGTPIHRRRVAERILQELQAHEITADDLVRNKDGSKIWA
jgi:hypothetical protein